LDTLGAVQGPKRKAVANHFIQLYDTEVLPHLGSLRSSIIHSDFNDNNVCVSDDESRVSGLFDFGDMVHSSTVNDIAIAAAYIVLGPIGAGVTAGTAASYNDVLDAVEQLTMGFHAKYPLSKLELQLIYPLLCARLTQSVLMSAHSRALEPDNEYLGITEGPAWRMLEQLVQYPLGPVTKRLHAACFGGISAPSSLAARTCAALRAQVGALKRRNTELQHAVDSMQ
jgi:Ser/Thr protein kinase RdoA (MazF antagonist)